MMMGLEEMMMGVEEKPTGGRPKLSPAISPAIQRY